MAGAFVFYGHQHDNHSFIKEVFAGGLVFASIMQAKCEPMKCAVLLLMTAVVLTTGCKKDKDGATPSTNPTPTVQTYPARTEMNVAYGDEPLQKMDVYFPEGYSKSTPVVFIIHGGGFIFGVKEDFTMQAEAFKKQGFITVNLSHRLVDTIGLIQQPPIRRDSKIKAVDILKDAHAAYTTYTAKAKDWKAGEGNMYMAGHSAGAILAMLYTQGDYNDDGHIKACGNWAGVTDFPLPHDSLLDDVDPRYLELMHRIAGIEFRKANILHFMAISPYWVANNNSGKPCISIYPEHNEVIKIPNESDLNLQNTKNYHTLLRNKGVAEKLTIYAGNDHGFGQPGSWDKLIAQTAAFFKEQE